MSTEYREHEINFLFIGGAPRSGTTLLFNLLDSHPQLIAFPAEHSTFENYFANTHQLQTYFLNDFINIRTAGQQTILANRDLLDRYIAKLYNEYGKEYSIDISPEKLKNNYLDFLSDKEVTLYNVIYALGYAVARSNEYLFEKFQRAKYFVFKQPYYTDLYASEIHKLIPDAKFIQIQRDPIARYSSAKKRRISISRHNKLGRINGTNFVKGHTEIDISSFELGLKNERSIGFGFYKVVHYENMLGNSTSFFEDIFKWLSIDFFDSYTQPTLLGKPVLAGSTMVSKKGVDKSAVNRNKEYYVITSWSERILHRYYISHSTLRNRDSVSVIMVLISFLYPLKKESLRHYLYRILFAYKLLDKKDLHREIQEKIKSREYIVMGAY